MMLLYGKKGWMFYKIFEKYKRLYLLYNIEFVKVYFMLKQKYFS